MSLHLNYKADNIYGSVTNKDKDACVRLKKDLLKKKHKPSSKKCNICILLVSYILEKTYYLKIIN